MLDACIASIRHAGGVDRLIVVANGDGESGGAGANPTIDIADTYAGQASIVTLGTVTTAVSFLVIAVAVGSFALVRRRRLRHGSDAGKAA